MPTNISDTLPARRVLEAEGIAVMGETAAVRQDIRPLRIGLPNLMPSKISAETQISTGFSVPTTAHPSVVLDSLIYSAE